MARVTGPRPVARFSQLRAGHWPNLHRPLRIPEGSRLRPLGRSAACGRRPPIPPARGMSAANLSHVAIPVCGGRGSRSAFGSWPRRPSVYSRGAEGSAWAESSSLRSPAGFSRLGRVERIPRGSCLSRHAGRRALRQLAVRLLFPCPGGSAAYERSAAARSGGARGADGCFSIQAEGKADGLVSRQLHHSAVGPNRHPRSVAADEAHAHQLRRIRDRHPALRHAPDAVGKRGRLSRRGGAVGAGSAACLGRPRCLFWSFTMTN